jgi:hypothetical protein
MLRLLGRTEATPTPEATTAARKPPYRNNRGARRNPRGGGNDQHAHDQQPAQPVQPHAAPQPQHAAQNYASQPTHAHAVTAQNPGFP